MTCDKTSTGEKFNKFVLNILRNNRYLAELAERNGLEFDDVVSMVFIKLSESGLPPIGGKPNLIYTTVTNILRDCESVRVNRERILEEVATDPSRLPGRRDQASLAAIEEVARIALDEPTLNDTDRLVIRLRLEGDLSFEQVAKQAGLNSANAAIKRFQRAVEKIAVNNKVIAGFIAEAQE